MTKLLFYTIWSATTLTSTMLLAQPVVPLPRAHAHNDYAHPRPLLDALDHGFCSVEADIFLIEGQLLVAHDRREVQPRRTLQTLYLNPLRERIKENGGRVYSHGPTCFLLIDLKTEAEATYTALHSVLKEYADMLTEFRSDQVKTNALTVIISGNRPEKTMRDQSVRYAAFDGRLLDLDTNPSPQFMPLVSNAWFPTFRWRGDGPFPPEEKAKLAAIVEKAHHQGRLVRFWGYPDRAPIWQALYEAGVDLINTDDLQGLQLFLRQQTSGKR